MGSGVWLRDDYDGINYITSVENTTNPSIKLDRDSRDSKMIMRLGGNGMGIETIGQKPASVIHSTVLYSIHYGISC